MLTKYATEEKQNIIKLYKNGENVKSICNKFGISKSTVYNWIHEYGHIIRPSGEAITPNQVYLLEKRIKRLESELSVWKQSGCSVNSPLQEKLEAIMHLHKIYGVHAACETLGVLRSTFYHYQRRRPEQTIIEQEDERLKPAIQKVFADSKGRLGAKKIRSILVEREFKVSAARITRLMKEMNLTCVTAPGSPKPQPLKSRPYFRNKLKQQFTQTEPNKVWVSDITYLTAGETSYYLCIIVDLFSRKVIAYTLSEGCGALLATTTFKVAYENRKPNEGLLFHSDQGSQYSSQNFRKLLRSLGVSQSFSNAGCPYDNAVAESFFRMLKAEETSRHIYENETELRASVDEYIHFFNNERPHQRLRYLTPSQLETRYFNQ